jgi:hypothetical protein
MAKKPLCGDSCGNPSFSRLYGLRYPGGGRKVFEFAADQVTHDDQAVIGGVAAGTCLGCLDQSIHGLDEAVGQTGTEVFQDALQMITYGGTQSFELRQARATCPTDSSRQPLLGHSDIGSRCEDRPECFLHTPCARCFKVAALQMMHPCKLSRVPVGGIFEQRPPATFKLRTVLGFGAANPFHGSVTERDHVEWVEAQRGIRTLLACPGLVSLGHVHADCRDGPGITAVRLKVVDEGSEGARIATGCGEQDSTFCRIVKQGKKSLPTPSTALIDGQLSDLGMTLLRPRFAHMMIQRACNPVTGNAQHARHDGHRHLSAQRHDKCFHQQREARSLARPWCLYLAGLTALPTSHARHACPNEGLELEEVQVLPRALDSVMQGLIGRLTVRTGQPIGFAVHHEINAPLRGREIHRRHRPRRGQTQSLSGEFFHRPSLPLAA